SCTIDGPSASVARVMCTIIRSTRRRRPGLRAARGSAARGRFRLARPDERAGHLAVHLRSDAIHVDTRLREKRSRVLYLIDAPRFDRGIREAGGLQLRNVLVIAERPGNTPDPEFQVPANLGWHLAADDDVRDGETATRLQHAERFAQGDVLVDREVDHAVGDDHVDRVVRKRDGLDRALQELDIRGAGLPLILAREREHLVGHVQAIHLASRADALRRQQHVDAATGAEVEHDFPWLQVDEGGRVAAAERGGHGLRRQGAGFSVRVEVRRDGISTPAGAGTATALRGNGPCDLAVLLPNRILNLWGRHDRLLLEWLLLATT